LTRGGGQTGRMLNLGENWQGWAYVNFDQDMTVKLNTAIVHEYCYIAQIVLKIDKRFPQGEESTRTRHELKHQTVVHPIQFQNA
jgi:hypothetical protein